MVIFLIGIAFGCFVQTGVNITNDFSECKKYNTEQVCKDKGVNWKSAVK